MTEPSAILTKLKTGVDREGVKKLQLVKYMALAAGAGAFAYFAGRHVRQALTGLGLLGSTISSSVFGDYSTKFRLSESRLVANGFSYSELPRIMPVQPYVDRWSRAYNLDPDLVNGVIYIESRFHQTATSSAGARGLMQLMPGTQTFWEGACGTGPGDAFNAEHNIRVGCCGLRRLLDALDGDVRKALAAYNWGIGNVKDGTAWPDSVRNYVDRVLAESDRFRLSRSE